MPRSSRAPTSLELRAVPDPRKRLSDGVLVDACIRARLLGIPLLKVEANVVLAPAGLTGPPISAPRDLKRRRSAEPGPPGQGLAEAVRRIREGAELLAEARRNGS
jgi:hypothetical protein